MKAPGDPVKMSKCEIVLIIDGEGNYGVGYHYDNAKEDYDNGDINEESGIRVFHLNLAVPLPVAAKIVGILPEQGEGEVALTVA